MDSTLDRIVSKHEATGCMAHIVSKHEATGCMAHIAMDPIFDCFVHKLEVPTADIHHHHPTDIREHQPVSTGSFVMQLFVVASFHPESTCL